MKHHILAIGISKYQDASIKNLSFASKDASEFYSLITSNVGNIGYKKLLIDNEASLSQIRAALGVELQSAIDAGDSFLFFFSGHGTTAIDESGINSTFIVSFDSTRDITNTGLSVSYLTNIFANLKSKANLIIIDSCFSGSVNLTKGITLVQTKSAKPLKSFNNIEISGQGTLIFTASKDDEEALEDPEYKNGLFTKYLLEELQIDRGTERHPLLHIFTPISEKVTERALKTYAHVQTPTMNGHIQGSFYLPNFKQKLQFSPDIQQPPASTDLLETAYQIPEIKIDQKDMEKIITDTINFILFNRRSIEHYPNSGSELMLEHHCLSLLRKLYQEWENIFSEPIADISEIPGRISRLEAASFQFVLLGCVISKFGSDIQNNIYSTKAVEIFSMINNKQGIVALIAAPEIILVEIIYYIGVICLANFNLKPLKILLETKIWDIKISQKPCTLLDHEEIYYSRALGGSSTTVNDHIRDSIANNKWLSTLEPKILSNEFDLQLQVNFLIAMLTLKNNYLWPDFARFYAHRLMPLINRIKYDDEFKEQVCNFLDVKKEDLYKTIKSRLEYLISRGLDRFHWQSIDPNIFDFEEEAK